MFSRIAADLTLLCHFAFVLFALFGAALVPIWPASLWVHLPVVLWSSLVNLASWTCPLTPLEQVLRLRAGQSGYSGGFVQHYVGSAVYPRGMPRQMELIAGVSVLMWNAAVYAVLFIWFER
jgi:hypothetical protein